MCDPTLLPEEELQLEPCWVMFISPMATCIMGHICLYHSWLGLSIPETAACERLYKNKFCVKPHAPLRIFPVWRGTELTQLRGKPVGADPTQCNSPLKCWFPAPFGSRNSIHSVLNCWDPCPNLNWCPVSPLGSVSSSPTLGWCFLSGVGFAVCFLFQTLLLPLHHKKCSLTLNFCNTNFQSSVSLEW